MSACGTVPCSIALTTSTTYQWLEPLSRLTLRVSEVGHCLIRHLVHQIVRSCVVCISSSAEIGVVIVE